MKAFTDIEQSKKLAEILPLESADMSYSTWTILESGEFIVSPNQGNTIENLRKDYGNQIIPCWSLAALIDLLPNGTVLSKSDTGRYFIGGLLYDNLLDACVDKIFTLKEREDLI